MGLGNAARATRWTAPPLEPDVQFSPEFGLDVRLPAMSGRPRSSSLPSAGSATPPVSPLALTPGPDEGALQDVPAASPNMTPEVVRGGGYSDADVIEVRREQMVDPSVYRGLTPVCHAGCSPATRMPPIYIVLKDIQVNQAAAPVKPEVKAEEVSGAPAPRDIWAKIKALFTVAGLWSAVWSLSVFIVTRIALGVSLRF